MGGNPQVIGADFLAGQLELAADCAVVVADGLVSADDRNDFADPFENFQRTFAKLGFLNAEHEFAK